MLDATAAESLRLELADMLCRRPARIRLDFSQVQRFSAIGLSLLVSFAHEAVRGESPPKVEAVGASVAVANLLRTTGLNKAFGRAIET